MVQCGHDAPKRAQNLDQTTSCLADRTLDSCCRASSPLHSQFQAEVAEYMLPQLNQVFFLYKPRASYQLQTCVFRKKHANLPGSLRWPPRPSSPGHWLRTFQAIVPLEHRPWPNFSIPAVVLFHSTQSAPHLSSPLAFCCVENRLQLLLDLIILWVRTMWGCYLFIFFYIFLFT